MKNESEPPPSFSNTPDAPVPEPVDLQARPTDEQLHRNLQLRLECIAIEKGLTVAEVHGMIFGTPLQTHHEEEADAELRQRLADHDHVTAELSRVDFSDAPEPTAEEVSRTTERLKQAGLRRLNELKEGKQ